MNIVNTPVKTVDCVTQCWSKFAHNKFDDLVALFITMAINERQRVRMLRQNGYIYLIRWDPLMADGEL